MAGWWDGSTAHPSRMSAISLRQISCDPWYWEMTYVTRVKMASSESWNGRSSGLSSFKRDKSYTAGELRLECHREQTSSQHNYT